MKKILLLLCLSILSIGANAQLPVQEEGSTINLDNHGVFAGVHASDDGLIYDTLHFDIQGKIIEIEYKGVRETSKISNIVFTDFSVNEVNLIGLNFNWGYLELVLYSDDLDRVGVVTGSGTDEYGDPLTEITEYKLIYRR